jgi:rubrerythrin
MVMEQVHELLYQALETEIGGIRVYETALRCAVNPDLRKEWQEYLEQTRNHEQVVRRVFEELVLDADVDTPGRQIVRQKAQGLVQAMEQAQRAGDPKAAQIVAAECVVDAETKDHLNWELIGKVAGQLKGHEAKALKEAFKEVEDEEDEHLYHTQGWTRELWFECMGMRAVLPPPEEKQNVRTAAAAAKAKKSRDKML